MAFPYSFIKLTFGGILNGTEEVWTCGMQLASRNAAISLSQLPNDGSTELNAIVDAIKVFYGSSDQRAPAYMRLNWVKMAAVDVNGRYIGKPVEVILSPFVGGASASAFIPSTAVVYTMFSNKFKDPGKYNRFYLPTVAPAGSNAFRETSVQGQARADSCATLIGAINTAMSVYTGNIKVRAVSQRVGLYEEIIGVRVGDVIDAQRRRRNRLYETYQESSV